jgi:hypothetical protein
MLGNLLKTLLIIGFQAGCPDSLRGRDTTGLRPKVG